MRLASTNPLEGFEQIISHDEPLSRHTWYKLGGPAKYFAKPRNRQEMSALVKRCAEENLPVYVLGLGANVLVRDEGIDGVVVVLSEEAWKAVNLDSSRVVCGAGADMARLTLDTARKGYGGFEVMAGIPGTVGGGIRMNAGGKYGDIGSVTAEVDVMDAAGNISTLKRDELLFEYRKCSIRQPYILSAVLELEEQDPEETVKRMKEIWMYKKNSQPLNAKSAGCVFKNPAPEVSGGKSAGALIDQAGLKGLKVGGAEVSEVHANFIVAGKGASAGDVMELIRLVRQRVGDHFGVQLETEVKLWPAGS